MKVYKLLLDGGLMRTNTQDYDVMSGSAWVESASGS